MSEPNEPRQPTTPGLLARARSLFRALTLSLARVRSRDPLAGPAAYSSSFATALILAAALVGAAIRLLPWILDPSIGWGTLAPFAKSLFAVAFEAALLIGWPVGWALATQRLVERGEARVLAALGESPARTVARLAPQAAIFGVVLIGASLVLAREAAAPGRVVNALLAKGRVACEDPSAGAAKTNGVPLVSVTWLCSPWPTRGPARLVGRAPLGDVVFTAEDATVSDDLRRIELARARLALPLAAGGDSASAVRVRVETLVLRGLAPWARASSLPPLLRAVVVAGSAFVAAWAAATAILRARRRRVGRVGAAAIGAAGPLAALAVLRALELRVPEIAPSYWLAFFAAVPCFAAVAVAAAFGLVTALPEARGTDSK